MLLIGVKEDSGWLLSRWNLTYKIGWDHICKATNAVYEYYENVEILVDNQLITVLNTEDIFQIEETKELLIRGISTILNAPIMITFYNQTNIVNVNVASVSEEFKVSDYQKFNMSLGQFMDSIELSMYH